MVADWVRGVERVVVLSGAGISTDSGIADFRGPNGVWTLNPGAEVRNTYRAFLADPALRASYWRSRREHPWDALPNQAHEAVTALVESDVDTTVVTQNTDGLHQIAGTPADRVVELHGTMHVVVCVACGRRWPTSEVIHEDVPACAECGGILKTDSTMFGQTMPPAVFARAERAAITCDLILAVGTSLVIEPAGSLCASAVRTGARLVIVNRDPTPYDGIATELVRTPIGEALPEIVRQLLAHAGDPKVTPAPTDAEARAIAVIRGESDGAPLAVLTPRVLVDALADTTPDQDRHALIVLARAAETDPAVHTCLTGLLSVLPGLAPAAVDAAITGGHPRPLADALTALARQAALPAELLDAIPPGTTVLGEFPVLLAQSLVDAYTARLATHPDSAQRGLDRMRAELAARLADAS